jgi:hypothetical protein
MWLSNSPWCLMWDAYCNVLTSRPVATKLITGMVGTFLGDMLAQGMQGLVAANASQQRSSRPSASARRSGASASAGSSSSSSDGAGFQVDLARTARLVGFSALVGTPVAFVWFSLLDQVRAARGGVWARGCWACMARGSSMCVPSRISGALLGRQRGRETLSRRRACACKSLSFCCLAHIHTRAQYVLPSDPTSPLAVFSKVALDQVLMAPLMTSLFFGAMAVLEGSARSPRAVADGVRAKLKPTLLANWTVWPLAHVVNFALVPPAQRILYINVVNVSFSLVCCFWRRCCMCWCSAGSASCSGHCIKCVCVCVCARVCVCVCARACVCRTALTRAVPCSAALSVSCAPRPQIAWTAFMSHMASSSDDTQTAQQRPQQQQPHAPAAARPKQLQQTGR